MHQVLLFDSLRIEETDGAKFRLQAGTRNPQHFDGNTSRLGAVGQLTCPTPRRLVGFDIDSLPIRRLASPHDQYMMSPTGQAALL
ncbi:hypothetical protein CEQ23_10440 [Burkholderia cepacia]|nr:hypothetical protein APZ15_05890 [Burkholderia cepacia ATCC 25416]ASE94003.1 hypothetical protein CEQ23_10440 [Burkholderia cepacia]